MAPFLLDNRLVRIVGILFVISILLCFVAGYILGYQHAIKNNASAEFFVSKLFIPSVTETVEINPVGEHLNGSNEPGENIDVDAPDSINNTKSSSSQPVGLVEKKQPNDNLVKNNKTETAHAALSTELEPGEVVDNANEGNAKFSIQVGLYGIKVNAERRVNKLIKKKLSGHLTNFVNGKGDTLYNVRFGYFLDKTSVLAALEIYQKKFTGDGYIIKLKQK